MRAGVRLNGRGSRASGWTFERLLAPLSPHEFLQRYWQREPLHVERHDPAYFEQLTSSREVDYLIATHGGKRDFPISVIGRSRAAPNEPAKPAPGRGHWTPENVYARLAEGATIRIGNMPAYSAAVRQLSAHVEAAINTDVAINLYLTPRGAAAFGAHFDNHDVLIAQLDGAKTWKIYEPPEDVPLEVTFRGRLDWLRKPLPFESTLLGRPAVNAERVVQLEAGDLLYVPRGYLHEVFTEERGSLHLTIAVPVVTWYEVAVHALIAASAKSRPLREALPPGFSVDPARRREAHDRTGEIVDALRDALDAADLRRSLDVLAEQFANSRDADWQGLAENVQALDEISLETALRIRPSLVYTTHRFRSHVCLLFSGRSFDVPLRAESMLDRILTGECFRVGELPSALDDESRLVFARALVARGFLVVDP